MTFIPIWNYYKYFYYVSAGDNCWAPSQGTGRGRAHRAGQVNTSGAQPLGPSRGLSLPQTQIPSTERPSETAPHYPVGLGERLAAGCSEKSPGAAREEESWCHSLPQALSTVIYTSESHPPQL